MTTKEIVTEARDRVERAANVVRRIIGVPDYDRYVAHVHAHHPDVTPMCQKTSRSSESSTSIRAPAVAAAERPGRCQFKTARNSKRR